MQTSQNTQSNNEPLVSIILITYNSSEYLLETLESAKAQTYRNIELIVSDDCSTDNTVTLCKTWLRENINRFANAKLIESIINTGISSNCNRGLKNSTGSWVKFIAGDDFLLPECISENIEFAKKHKAEFICSKIRILEDGKTYEPEYTKTKQIVNAYSQKKIIREMLKSDFVTTPSVFLTRELLIINGGFDETIPMMEDTPMWLKLLLNNTKFFFLDKCTVIHKEIHTSVSSYQNGINIKFHNSRKIFFIKTLGKELLAHDMYLHYIHYLIALKYRDLVIKNGNDENNLAFYKKCIKLLSPLWWKTKFLSISFFKKLNQ